MKLVSKEQDLHITNEDLATWIEREKGIKVTRIKWVDAGGFKDDVSPTEEGPYILVVIEGEKQSLKSQANICKCKRTEPVECGVCGKPLDMKLP